MKIDYSEFLKKNTDQSGLFIQKDGDGGDTLAKQGYFGIATFPASKIPDDDRWVLNVWVEGYRTLQPEPGVFVRHPKRDTFWSNPKTTSRDQMRSNIVAWGLYELTRKEFFRPWLKRHARRLFFFGNTQDSEGRSRLPDVTTPVDFGSIIRSGKFLLLRPLLLLTDCFLILSALETALKYRRTKDGRPDAKRWLDIMPALCLFWQAWRCWPTPVSRYAVKLLFRLVDVRECVSAYFRVETNAPPFHELFNPILEEMSND